MRLLGYIVMSSEDYEGLDTAMHDGDDNDPLPVFDSRSDAEAWAKSTGMRMRNTEILAIDLNPDPEPEPDRVEE